jgi:hypothetical protein
VADSGGCSTGKKIRPLFAPLERMVHLGVYREDGNFRQGLAVRHTQPHRSIPLSHSRRAPLIIPLFMFLDLDGVFLPPKNDVF